MTNIKTLNKEQREVIDHGRGPLLIIAGAGTGKTTVITKRIKNLILKKHIPASQILALTFTDKASREMEERIDIEMPYGYTQMWISTFHSFCDRILRTEAIHIGLNPSYRLMTEAESLLFLRNHIFQFKLDYFRPLGNPNKFLEGMLQHFSRLKDEDVSPNEYLRWAKAQSSKIDQEEIKKNLELALAFKVYEELKVKEGVMDFSDLIANTLRLFRTRKNILKIYQDQFLYILVDEFQDTNFAQNQLAILLSGERKNITVVGDDDQAIYRWRGAAISNIIQFKKQFPDAKIVTLTQNYRSTQEILDSAYRLVQFNNPDRLEIKENINKKLSSQRKVKAYPIELFYEERVEDEADRVVKKIQELTMNHEPSTNYQYKDIAILVRANDHAQGFVKALQRYNIPYQFLGPGRLFRQEEIKDLIAYLKVLYNFEDSLSLYRVLTLPVFNLEARDIASLLNFAKRKSLRLFEALEKITESPQTQEIILKNDAQEKIKKIVDMIKRHLKRVPTDSSPQILYYFLEDSGMLKQFLAPVDANTKKYQNIAKFFDKLKSFEVEHEDARIFPVVDWIDLSMQMGESPLASDIDWSENNAVNILTIHSSKGLEFPVVFLVNLVSLRFPTRERREQIPVPVNLIKEILPVGDYHLQEERRLFYVGMTRARDRLFFTASNFYGEGKRERKLSPFVYEAQGQEVIEKILGKQKRELTIVQPSLLDWAPNAQAIRPTTRDQMPKTSINYLSYSQIQTFKVCPLHYKLQYLLRIPYQPRAALSFGSSVHSALRDFYQKSIQNNNLKAKDIIPILEQSWIDEGYDNKDHKKEALDRAKHILLQYLKANYETKTDAIKPIAIEMPFNFFIRDPYRQMLNLKVGGKIDRIDKIDANRIEIIDYKTGRNLPDQKELADNLQLTLYALAATQINNSLFNKKPEDIILSLHYLEEEKKLTTTRTAKQLKEAKTKILEVAEEIKKSDFTCSKSSICQNCEYKILCSSSL